MNEEDDSSATGDEALDSLRFGWGDAYDIAPDSRGGYQAVRRDGRGEPLRAGDADGLRHQIWQDYGMRPVSRDYARRPA